MKPQTSATPWRSILLWIPAALAGAAGLVLAHGFDVPVIDDAPERARLLMAAGLGLFALSRLVMLVPATGLGARLSRWWVDFALLGAALAWWIAQPDAEDFILRAGTAYLLIVGAVAIFRAGIGSLANGLPGRTTGSAARRLAGCALLLVLVGGLLLTLPALRRASEAVDAEHSLAWYHLKVEFLNSTFTAAAALTGTGLAVQDIGSHYNRAGQCVILALMLAGGLGVLSMAAIIGMHFRRLLDWAGADDDLSSAGLRRLVLFVCVFALVAQALGAVGVYRMWDPAVDLNFGTATREPALLASLVARTGYGEHYDEPRLFASVFHSVSAFCNGGLALTRDDYVAYRHLPGPLLGLMPLMFLGSLGGPVLFELLKRMIRRRDIGLESVSRDSWLTLGGSVGVLLLGAAALFGIESTREFQQRYPREKTPGRLMLNSATTASTQPADASAVASTQPDGRTAIEFSAATAPRAQAERLSGMNTRDRVRAVLFQAEAARTGGARSARIDEPSLSPASHLVLMGLMLVGGGVGGTAGGMRITVVLLLVGAVFAAGRTRRHRLATPQALDAYRALGMAAGVAAGMLLLIGLVAVVLLYHETGSPMACLFEAVSACCNVGLSLGLTSDLSLTGRIVVILAMLVGRLLPLAILMRCIAGAAPPSAKPPLRANIPDDDAPIPLA